MEVIKAKIVEIKMNNQNVKNVTSVRGKKFPTR